MLLKNSAVKMTIFVQFGDSDGIRRVFIEVAVRILSVGF